MGDMLKFWLMKSAAEMTVAVILLAAIALLYGSAALYVSVKQRLCRHEQVHENSRCHAQCSDCKKDLGFYGTWSKKRHG